MSHSFISIQPMTELYLVRHGETAENVAGILQGHLPGTLTPAGRAQAVALREQLAGCHFDVMLTSDLRRAADTARLLNATLGLPLVTLPLLRERDWGELTGCPVEEARGRKMPPSVETVKAMSARALNLLRLVAGQYEGRAVLAVTHGLFARCVQAVWSGTTIREVPRMANTEVRRLCIDNAPVRGDRGVAGADVVSAD